MRIFAFVLSVVCAVTQFGCVTSRLLEWSHDEVSIKSSTLQVKSVPTRPDGLYAVVVPADWSQEPVVEAADGLLELAPPAALLLSKGWQSENPGASKFRVMKKSDAYRPFSRSGVDGTETAAYIDRRPGRNFRIHLLFGDETRHRWVQIGTVNIGPGTQSAMRRPIAYVALPGAVIVDVATIPVLLIGAVVMVSAEGIGALAEKFGSE